MQKSLSRTDKLFLWHFLLLVNLCNLFLNSRVSQEVVVADVGPGNDALRPNFDDMVGDSLNELVVVGSEQD